VARVIERHGFSQRRACRLIGIDHSVLRYESKRLDDAPLRQRLRELAQQRRRFGYRRLGWLLVREGYRLNHKRLYRLYREEKLMVRRRRGRKRALGTRTPLPLPRLRDECLNEHAFLSLTEAREIITSWRHDYNCARPHSSLGTLTPSEFAKLQGDGPPEQAQGSAARPLAPPPQPGHNINPGLYA